MCSANLSHYKTKTDQRAASGGRCAYCGRHGSTQSHHLWIRRRGKEAEKRLQCDINQVQLCPMCHAAETYRMQVYVGLAKLWEMHEDDPNPPGVIEGWADNLPFKVRVDLPSHYWEAVDLYHKGVRPGQYKVMGR